MEIWGRSASRVLITRIGPLTTQWKIPAVQTARPAPNASKHRIPVVPFPSGDKIKIVHCFRCDPTMNYYRSRCRQSGFKLRHEPR